jgi:molecular chaperone DnaK
MASGNKSLGKFQLTGIPPAPRGIPQIEVAFDINTDGIVSVSAKDLGTGTEQKIEIKAGSGLSDDEINKMVADAAAHADEDAKAKDLAEARNEGENLAYQVEKQIKDNGDKLEDVLKETLETQIKDVRDAAQLEDIAEIKAKTEALAETMNAAAEELYKAAAEERDAATNGASADGSDGDNETEEEIVDAEVVDEGK